METYLALHLLSEMVVTTVEQKEKNMLLSHRLSEHVHSNQWHINLLLLRPAKIACNICRQQ